MPRFAQGPIIAFAGYADSEPEPTDRDGIPNVEQAERSGSSTPPDAAAGDRYLLLADITGYTGFMTGVEQEHGVDFSAGIPAAYAVLGDLLAAVILGRDRVWACVTLDVDAVCAAAPGASLDGQGDRVLMKLRSMYGGFTESRTRAMPANDHVCVACPAVAHLDLKVVLHRGFSVRQSVGSGSDLLGPAVTVAHRLLKNNIRSRIGSRPYIFLTDSAATGLGLADAGLEHREEYPDAREVQGRVLELGEPVREDVSR